MASLVIIQVMKDQRKLLIKHSFNYSRSPINIMDTGCSNGSFTKDKPSINFMTNTGIVEAANDSKSQIHGKGTIKLGSISVSTKWVPSFQKNLINVSDSDGLVIVMG